MNISYAFIVKLENQTLQLVNLYKDLNRKYGRLTSFSKKICILIQFSVQIHGKIMRDRKLTQEIDKDLSVLFCLMCDSLNYVLDDYPFHLIFFSTLPAEMSAANFVA